MEDLINPHWSDINSIIYCFWEDEPFIAIAGLCYVEGEKSNFGIEEKIEKLNAIIVDIISHLKDDSYENKKYIISQLKEKQNLLKDQLTKFKEIKQNYCDNDRYYRDELFNFYKAKYYEEPLLSYFKKKKYIAIMFDIQKILHKKFQDFCREYVKIRDDFFKINTYIIKVKKFFNFPDKANK